jgi:hypothetical protein
MSNEFIIPSQTGKSFQVEKGDLITIIDLEGKQVVDFFAVNSANSLEFLSTGVTIDCNQSLKIKKWDRIYTNLYKVMFRIIEDDVEGHDLLHPCCRREMYEFFYQNGEGHKNCFDNINQSLAQYGINKFSLIQPFNIFMNTSIKSDGKIAVEEPRSQRGDKISLLVEMDAIVSIAACSVSESKCNGGSCTPIKVIINKNGKF